jgi:hypothetical protein
MERRRAVIAAATASLTLLAGAAAISLNTGIVRASDDDGVGQISPVDPTTISDPVTIDAPAAGAPTGSYEAGDDDHGEDREIGEAGDDHGDDNADDEHEYEGADDDD